MQPRWVVPQSARGGVIRLRSASALRSVRASLDRASPRMGSTNAFRPHASAPRILAALSVSDGDDPTGNWRSSVLDTFDGNAKPPDWADYPSLGVDERAVYIAYNVSAARSRVMIFEKTNLYEAGAAAFFVDPTDETTMWVFGGVGHETDKTLWATSVEAL
jgi:hypothetical protein